MPHAAGELESLVGETDAQLATAVWREYRELEPSLLLGREHFGAVGQTFSAAADLQSEAPMAHARGPALMQAGAGGVVEQDRALDRRARRVAPLDAVGPHDEPPSLPILVDRGAHRALEEPSLVEAALVAAPKTVSRMMDRSLKNVFCEMF